MPQKLLCKAKFFLNLEGSPERKLPLLLLDEEAESSLSFFLATTMLQRHR